VERRPIISLEPNLDESLGSPRLVGHSMRDPDEVSLQLDHNEERDLDLCSDNDSDYDEHASNITSTNDTSSGSLIICLTNLGDPRLSSKLGSREIIGLRSTEWSLSLFLLDLER
jgi:hypothetical protein